MQSSGPSIETVRNPKTKEIVIDQIKPLITQTAHTETSSCEKVYLKSGCALQDRISAIHTAEVQFRFFQ